MSGVGFAWAGKETKGRKRLESGVGSLGGRGGGWSSGCTVQRSLTPSSRKFLQCWWEPRGGTSAAAASPLDFCCLQIVWHQQTFLMHRISSVLINSQEGPALLCPC